MISFLQLNTHKAQLAAIELHNELGVKSQIAMITEPYTYKNKLVNVPRTLLSVGPQDRRRRKLGRLYMSRQTFQLLNWSSSAIGTAQQLLSALCRRN